MDQKFNGFVKKWQSSNVSEAQNTTVVDWLMGRNQTEFVPSKTTLKRDNNILETPYCVYNRYKVEFLPSTSSLLLSSSANADNLT
jgi:hypothetical protein